MKLHLILLASVFNLSSGFVAEVRGALSEETCTGDEFADFKGCVMKCVAANPNLAGFVDVEDAAFMNREGDRRLNLCAVCPPAAMFRGHWCFYVCGSTRRRRLEEEEDIVEEVRGLESGSHEGTGSEASSRVEPRADDDWLSATTTAD